MTNIDTMAATVREGLAFRNRMERRDAERALAALVEHASTLEREKTERMVFICSVHGRQVRLLSVCPPCHDDLLADRDRMREALEDAHRACHRWWGRSLMTADFYRDGLEAVDAIVRSALFGEETL